MRAQRVAAGRFLREGDALRVRGGFGKGTLTKDLGGAMAAWEGDLTWIGVGGVGALRIDCRGEIPSLNTCDTCEGLAHVRVVGPAARMHV